MLDGFRLHRLRQGYVLVLQDEPEDFLICTGESVSLRENQNISLSRHRSIQSTSINRSIGPMKSPIFMETLRALDVLNHKPIQRFRDDEPNCR